MQTTARNGAGTESVPASESIRTAVLTPRGEAVMLLYRLLRAIDVLAGDDRRAVRELLEPELADYPA